MTLNETNTVETFIEAPNGLLELAMFLPQCFYFVILLLGVYGMYQGIEIQVKK